MKSYPKNKKEQVGVPYGILVVVLCLVVVGLLIFIKARATQRRLASKRSSLIVDSGPAGESKRLSFVDLSGEFNAGKGTNWLAGRMARRTLAEVPKGINAFGNMPFRVQEGLLQLSGTRVRQNTVRYPDVIKGIPVRLNCTSLHFLHGAAWSAADGAQIGAYIVHFADGTQEEVAIQYGTHLRDWCYEKDIIKTENTAWSSTETGLFLRLYRASWQNPKPGVEVVSIDFVSLGTTSAPFLLAVTAE